MNGKVRMMQTLGRFRDGIVRAFQTDRVVSTEADFIVALTSKNVGTIRLADDIVLHSPITLEGAYNTIIDGGGRFGFRRARKNTAKYLFDIKSNTASDLAFIGVSFTLDDPTGRIFVGDGPAATMERCKFQNIDTDEGLFGSRAPPGIRLNGVDISARALSQSYLSPIDYTTSSFSVRDFSATATNHIYEQYGRNTFASANALQISSVASEAIFNSVAPIGGAYVGGFTVDLNTKFSTANPYVVTRQTNVVPTAYDITVSGADPVIDVKQYTNVRITDDGTTSGNASFTAGVETGHQVLIIFEGAQGYSIPATGTFKSHSNFNPNDHDTLLIVWNESHGHWLEVSRSNN